MMRGRGKGRTFYVAKEKKFPPTKTKANLGKIFIIHKSDKN